MRIVTRREPKDPLYRFDCGHCGSTLECEKRELTMITFDMYNYICPVCGSSQVIGDQFLKEVER